MTPFTALRSTLMNRGRALLAAALLCAGCGSALSADMIQVRDRDRLRLKNGDVLEGVVSKTDTAGRYRVKVRTRSGNEVVREVSDDEIAGWDKAARREDEIERLAAEYKGDGVKIATLAQEVFRRFPDLKERGITVLQNEARVSKHAEVLGLLVAQLLAKNDPRTALAYASEFVNAHGSNALAYCRRGQVHLALGDLPAAKADIGKAYGILPDHPEVAQAHAELLARAGNAQQASDILKNLRTKLPDNLPALVGQGDLLLKQGDFTGAEECYTAALEKDDKHKDALLGRAAARAMLGRIDEAYRDADRVLLYNPRTGRAYGIQAFTQLLANDPALLPKFYSKLQEALKEDPRQPRLLLAWAAALEQEARRMELAGDKDSLAAASLKRREADAKYLEVMNDESSDAYLQYFIGERKAKLGDLAGAEKAFKRVTELAPSYAPGWGALGAVALRQKNAEVAEKAYTKASELDTTVAEYVAGRAIAILGDNKRVVDKRVLDAEPLLTKARTMDSRCATAYLGLGYIKNWEKNRDASISFFLKALAADGSLTYAAEALSRIFAQDNRTMEYLSFEGDALPRTWKARGTGAIRPAVRDGQLIFAGKQGANQGAKIEVFREMPGDRFIRLEADLDCPPSTRANLGLRLSAAGGSQSLFEFEFGKDDLGGAKVRLKDMQGGSGEWQDIGLQWPADGKMRLGIETDDLAGGVLYLIVNGTRSAKPVELKLQGVKNVSAGFFVQAAANETVEVRIDNVVLVTFGGAAESGGPVVPAFNSSQPAPAPAPAPAQDAPKDGGK